jgi:hypothetical protein
VFPAKNQALSIASVAENAQHYVLLNIFFEIEK